MNSTLLSISLTPKTEKLRFGTKLAYGVGEVASSAVTNIRVFFLLFFLTNVAGLNATMAGTVLLIGRVWDAVNDPLIGWLSDRTRSRWGKRHPWMVLGAIPFGIFFFLPWVVPHFSLDFNSNQGSLFWYYVIVALLFDTAYTVVTLPYAALAPEMTKDYNERTSLISIQQAFSVGAGIFALVLAQFIFSMVADSSSKYLILGGVCAGLSVLTIYVCVWGTRQHTSTLSEPQSKNNRSVALPLWSQIRTVLNNRAFQLVTGTYVCFWVSVQVSAAVLPYFVVNWMRLPEQHFTQLAIVIQVTSLSMMFVWGWVSQRIGKKAVYFLGIPVLIVSQTGLFFLQSGQVGLMYCCGVGIGIGLSIVYLIPWSMLPDVIDLDELESGQRREGLFYGFMVQMQKFGLAIALFLVGKGLDWAGLIPAVAGKPAPIQPDSALLAIRLEIGPLPTLALFCGLVLAYFYPITREVHAEILLKLREQSDIQSQE